MSASEPQINDASQQVEQQTTPVREETLVSRSIAKALEIARDRLLDRSLRNKLINTPLQSSKARQVRCFDELSDQVFSHLRSKQAFSFLPGKAGSAQESGESGESEVWVPSLDNDPGRHSDNKLQTKMTSDGLQKRLLSLFYEGQTLEEEQGVNVLFLALGFLEWREDKNSDISRFAPLILLPVGLTRDGAADRFKLRLRDEDLFSNISLQAWLKEQFRIDLPEIPEVDDWRPTAYFDSVTKVIEGRSGWAVHPNEILLGFFSFSKFLLWRDLKPDVWGALAARLLESPLLRRLLLRDDGDEQLADVPLISDEQRIDEVFKPIELVHVTDADSSQAIAIQEVLAGKDLVIQGPPGTGKSQTITNIIAGAVERGKRVLFIAEKMAALDVVHDRLRNKKLEPICLELHSRKSSKSQVLDQIKRAQAAAAPPKWSESAFDELAETQKRLREYSDRLHHCTLNGFTPYQVIGSICLLKERGVPTPDFVLPSAGNWTAEELNRNRREAAQVALRIATCGTPSLHPWRGVGISAPDILTQDRLRPIVDRCAFESGALSRAASEIGAALQFGDEQTPAYIRNWIKALDVIGGRPSRYDDIIAKPSILDLAGELEHAVEIGMEFKRLTEVAEKVFRPEAFDEEWVAVRRVLAAYSFSLFRIFSSEYRAAVSSLRSVWKGDFPGDRRERLAKLDALLDQQRLKRELGGVSQNLRDLMGAHWKGFQSNWESLSQLVEWLRRAKAIAAEISVTVPVRLIEPQVAREYSKQLSAIVNSTMAVFEEVRRALLIDWTVAFDTADIESASISLLHAASLQWSQNLQLIVDWVAAREGLKFLRSIGAGDLADRIYDGRISPELLEPTLMLAVYEAIWSAMQKTDPQLAHILGDELRTLVSRFRKADVDRIALASDQTRRSHLDRHPAGTSGAVGVLLDEMRKQRNLMPVRKLMLTAGEAIQKFKPVFLMSPLSVAQYLQPGALEFDLLVIDEASQVRPEDALGAIARSKQLVVVGDDRQLPPTNFFNRTINDDAPDDDEDDESQTPEGGVRTKVVKDVESILNLCARFPSRMLKWHYRSAHPALIATSNRNFYGGELMLPPSVVARISDGATGLMFREVPQGGYERGKTARNEVEANLIAEAVLKHARECPELSLGIGTFSVAQRDCIRDCIDNLARKNPVLDAFAKGAGGREPLFIKNLENIQGDERDVILISIGYGRDANGKLTQNFGPVGREGGERRLNVLITRARQRCEVFSSVVADDIRLDGVGKPGIRALKEFLKLAKDGYSAIATETSRGFDSPFEEAVASAVRSLGYAVEPQVGMAGFFIDLAVKDPRDEGRYILGIECDGAAYHSSRYARDRDRLRQEILEKRGWHIHRIWSTDWFYKPEREIAKVRAAIEAAVSSSSVGASKRENTVDEAKETTSDVPQAGSGEPSQIAPPQSNRQGLVFYQQANFTIPGAPILPQNIAEPQLRHWLKKIVEIEQPIHLEEIARRLTLCCGKQRTGSQISEVTKRALLAAKRAGELVAEGEFWVTGTGVGAIARDRSNLESNDPVRKPSMIAPSEYETAAYHALRQNLALSAEELLTETARLLGFARVGPDVRAAISSVIDGRVAPKVERDHLGRLRTPEN